MKVRRPPAPAPGPPIFPAADEEPPPPPATTKKSASKSVLIPAAPSENLFQSELSLYSSLLSVVFKRRSQATPVGL
jgi:hypothetical protein